MPDHIRQRRLNPFALPTETNIRFILLIVAALLLTATLVYQTLQESGVIDWYGELVSPRRPDIYVPGTFELRPDALLQIGRIVAAHLATVGAEVLALGFVLTIAFILYQTHPWRIRFRKKLTAWPRDKDPDFLAALDDLARDAGLSAAPAIEVDSEASFTGAQAFGLRKDYRVRVGKRMPLLRLKRPAMFQAVIQHEFAHFTNGDVGRTYLAQGLWIGAIVTIGAALVVLLFHSTLLMLEFVREGTYAVRAVFAMLRLVVIHTFQGVMLVAVVQIIRGSLLRVREIYADWRSASWGAYDRLEEILETHAVAEKRPGWWRRIWLLHPSALDRLNTLRDPKRLFEIGLDLPFFVGVLTGLMLLGVYELGGLLGSLVQGVLIVMFYFVQLVWMPIAPESISGFYYAGELVDLVVSFAPFILTGLLTVGTLGIQVERQALAGLSTHSQHEWKPYAKLLMPALVFTLGLQIGFWIIPGSQLSPTSWGQFYPGWITDMLWFAYDVTIWFMLGTLAVWAWLIQMRFFAFRLFGAHLGRRPPDVKRRILNLGMGVNMSLLLFAAFQGQLYMIAEDYDSVYSLLALAATFAAYMLTLGIWWLLVKSGRLMSDRGCPTCGQGTRRHFAVGWDCEHCGLSLTSWAYAAFESG